MAKRKKIIDEIVEILNGLSEEKIIEVRDFIDLIKRKENSLIFDKANMVSLMGSITPEDIETMKLAIDEACEKIDLDEW
jgi:hypothetical protein